jgi:hypothetical protein
MLGFEPSPIIVACESGTLYKQVNGEKEASIHKGSTQLQRQYIPNQCILIIDTHSILF